MLKPPSFQLHSLRNRAIFYSAAISLMIVIVSVIGYMNFNQIHKDSSTNLLKRSDLLVQLNLIRSELLDSYKELNNFLLEPDNLNYQKSIIVSVKEAHHLSEQLYQHAWIEKYKKNDTAISLINKMASLKDEVNKLIAVRLNVNNQYPSLAVGASDMQPNRNRLNNALALAINEMHAEKYQTKKLAVYRAMITTRHLWDQVLSNSRLYLANRVGSFNADALPIQEKGIETLYAEYWSVLQQLKKYADAEELGFESTDAVEIMLEASSGWFEGYKKVKVINHSDEWRQDAKIMKEIISPTIDTIVELLIELEEIVETSSKDDVQSVSSLADSHNITLWVIALIGVLFTIAIIVSLDKLIFKPIAVISSALKFEAMGKQSDVLPQVKAQETEDLVNAFNEMSRQVHLRQTELEYRALHDSLTSLPNRTLLLDRVEHDISTARREGQKLCLLIVDLNDFKEINDTLGHTAGDNLLIKIGNRIKSSLRNVDTVARIGGDEFSILLPNTDQEQAIITSQKILSTLSNTVDVEGVDVAISASIGVAMYPDHGEDVHSLLRYADIAMYIAKRNKIGVEVYSAENDEHSVTRLAMTQDFRDALLNDKLEVHFQPVYRVDNKTIVALEALSRWTHPQHGAVSPETFVTMAEQTGLINELTDWVLDKSISRVIEWNNAGRDLCVAVNLSVFNLKDPGFTEKVRSTLNKYDYPPGNLKLEITESAMMENPLQAIEVLTELSQMGIRLSIDDYGTGFSSMAYLKQLPVDELKIDKSFVIGVENDEKNDAIVRSTIDLAHNLGLKVVAEGIETEAASNILMKYGCDMAQGFFLGKPLPAGQTEKLLS